MPTPNCTRMRSSPHYHHFSSPPELRYQILLLALATQDPINIHNLGEIQCRDWIPFDRSILQLVKPENAVCIMSVNKQIFIEASNILFSEFAFGFELKGSKSSISRVWLHKLNNHERIARLHI